jgi:hypothetical protein
MFDSDDDLQLDLDILTMLRAVAVSEPHLDSPEPLSYEVLVETLEVEELRDMICGLASFTVGLLEENARQRHLTLLEVIDEEIRDTMQAQAEQ